jgi:uncharacterized protein
VLALVAAILITSSLGELVLGRAAVDEALSPVISTCLTLLAVLGAHVLMLRVVERRPWSDIGFGAEQARPRALAWGALLGAVGVAVPVLLLLAASWLRVDTAPPGGAASWLRAAAAALALLAPAALLEELIFRGYPFMVLRESAGPVTALLLTGVIFGLVHAENPGASPGPLVIVALAGIFLGAVLLVTGSLWAAWTAHLAWNWVLAAVVHASVSGLPFETPVYRVVDAGPDWLTGGPWGPEGGAGAAAGILGALALLVAHRRRAHGGSFINALIARPERRGGS